MAITDPSGSIEAFITDDARHQIARAVNGEVVFRSIGFSVGRGGYNPLDPVQVLPVNPADTGLSDQCFPPLPNPPEPFIQIEQPTFSAVSYDCRLAATLIPTPADYGLGELGIWAEIIQSAVPSEIGTIFLMALAHMPIRAKTNRDTMLLRVVVNY